MIQYYLGRLMLFVNNSAPSASNAAAFVVQANICLTDTSCNTLDKFTLYTCPVYVGFKPTLMWAFCITIKILMSLFKKVIMTSSPHKLDMWTG